MIAAEPDAVPACSQTRGKGIELVPVFVLTAVTLGVILRVQLVAGSDFPLGDGGLFYTMARDIQAAGYSLPLYTSYNAGAIPFAYPPLQIYLAALTEGFGIMPLMDGFRFWPLLASLLAIGAFYLMAVELLGDREESALATGAFSLLPGTFYWNIMGGGLTRSAGFLFALLTIASAARMYSGKGRRWTGLTAIAAALTITSHPTMASFAAIACFLLFLGRGRNRAGTLRSLAVVLGALVLSAPWWLTVLVRFGPAPFAGATDQGWSTAGVIAALSYLTRTAVGMTPAIAFLWFLGFLCAALSQRYLLIGWLAVMVTVEFRAFDWVSAVPTSLLAGIGAARLVSAVPKLLLPERRNMLVWALALTMLIHAAWTTNLVAKEIATLGSEERAAMAWVAANLPPESAFLVLASTDSSAHVVEWFPTLSGRSSLTTGQGYEWRGNGEAHRRGDLYQSSMQCVQAGADCLTATTAVQGVEFDYLYLSREWKRSALARDLEQDPRYVVIHDGPGATIYRGVSQ